MQTEGPGERQVRDAVGEQWNNKEFQQIVDATLGASHAAVVEAEVEFLNDGASGLSRQLSIAGTDDGLYELLG